MIEPNVYHTTRSIYLTKLIHLLLCVILVVNKYNHYSVIYIVLSFYVISQVLCICDISLAYIIVNNTLQSYGSVYYVYTGIIEKVLICTSSAGVILGACGILFTIRNNYILVILVRISTSLLFDYLIEHFSFQYGPLTFLLFLIEICVCIIHIHYVYNSVIDNYMAKELKNHFLLYNNITESRKIIDYIQEKVIFK